MNPEVTITNIDHASLSTVGAFRRTDLFETALPRNSRLSQAQEKKRDSVLARWLEGQARPGMVQKMLCHYPRNPFRAKKHAQNSNLKTNLKKQHEHAISRCCSMKEKDAKSEPRGMEKELEKNALAPRNTITRSAIIASMFHESSPQFNLFWVLFLASFLKTHCRRRCQKCSALTHGSISEPRNMRKTAI